MNWPVFIPLGYERVQCRHCGAWFLLPEPIGTIVNIPWHAPGNDTGVVSVTCPGGRRL